MTHRSLFLRVGSSEAVYADLRLQNRQDHRAIIILEVKCFSDRRKIVDEFYSAVGQYVLYRNVLRLKRMSVDLYLSVPASIYDTFFQRRSVQATIEDMKIRIIVIDVEREEVVRWYN